MTPLERTELEKLAVDAGFDRTATESDGWLMVRSSHFAELVELQRAVGGHTVVRLENAIRSRDVFELAGASPSGQPGDWLNHILVSTDSDVALFRLLEFVAHEAMQRRDSPLSIFRAKTRGLPSATEVERLIIARIGQDVFRASLIEYWDAKCAVTGCSLKGLLRASHIKPWAKCESDEERLDPFNGLLLAPSWDAAFDAGLVTFTGEGAAVLSSSLLTRDREALGLAEGAGTWGPLAKHEKYLEYHRRHVFLA